MQTLALPPLDTDGSEASMQSKVSPPNLDHIASLVLELSTTSNSTSTNLPASTSELGASTFASASTSTGIESNASSSAPPLTGDVTRSLQHPYYTAPSSMLSPFAFNPRASVPQLFPESSVGLAKRFTGPLTPTSLLTSSSTSSAATRYPFSPHIPAAMQYAKYASMLPSAPTQARTNSEASGLAPRAPALNNPQQF